jgi:hypothetical protein
MIADALPTFLACSPLAALDDHRRERRTTLSAWRSGRRVCRVLPGAVAVDATNVYWADAYAVMKLAKP